MSAEGTRPELPFRVEPGGDPNVVIVTVDVPDGAVTKDWEQWFLLRSDAHHDNPDCNRELEMRHLAEARERNAGILDNGDLFCAMQGKYDKRSDKSKVRPEHQVSNYLDALISTAADDYEPFAHHLISLGEGNHEVSIRTRHETDLTQRLVSVLNDRTGSKIIAGGYTTWVLFRFRRGEQRTSKVLWMIHGYAGGGPVTKDMIQFNRQLGYIEATDMFLSGHTHDSWATDVTRKYLDRHTATVKNREVTAIKCPTYKDEYKSGKGGWHIGTGKPPKPLGAYWLRFYWKRRTLQYEVTRAK